MFVCCLGFTLVKKNGINRYVFFWFFQQKKIIMTKNKQLRLPNVMELSITSKDLLISFIKIKLILELYLLVIITLFRIKIMNIFLLTLKLTLSINTAFT